MRWGEETTAPSAQDRRRNVIVAVVGLLILAAIVGWWWFAQRETGIWIDFERSGGIRGYSDSLELSEDGSATYSDGSENPPTAFDVPNQLMTVVRFRLEDVDWDETRLPPIEPECCDVIYFVIRHEDHLAYASDLTEADDELSELIAVLLIVLQDAPGYPSRF